MSDRLVAPFLPSLDWYLDIVETAPDPIDIIDRNGVILYHNQAAVPENFPLKSLVGHTIYEFFLPEYYETVQRKIRDTFETGKQNGYELASDYEQERQWYFTRIGPIIRDGQVVAATLFIRDISRMKRFEGQLAQQNRELEDRVQERTHALNAYANHLESSEKLNRALRKAESFDQVIDYLVKNGKRAMEADLVGVYRVQGRQLVLALSADLNEPPPQVLTSVNDSCFYPLLHTDDIKFIPLSNQPDPTCAFGDYLYREGMQALLVAPLMAEKRLVGGLYFGFKDIRTITTDDEQLLHTFIEAGANTLHRIEVMEELNTNLQDREKSLHVLFKIMSATSEVQDPITLLERSLQVTQSAVHYQVAVIHLNKTEGQELAVAVQENFTDEMASWFALSGLENDLWYRVCETGRTVEIRSLPMQSFSEHTGPEALAYAYLGVPIRVKGRVIGVLSYFGDETLFDQGKRLFIRTAADQIGLAWDNLQQRKIDEANLIVEERQRLANNLHDSVSQSLYGLVLWANAGNKLLRLRSYPELSKTLADIEEVAVQSLKEMRLLLFELRPPAFETEGLVSALDFRLNTVEQRAGMSTEFNVSGREFLPRTLDLEIYRIATEALNNSLRHSKASNVKVNLYVTPTSLTLLINDDGQGFDKAQVKKGGLGLTTMMERARKIGGTLTLDSSPGRGTNIRLLIPLA